MDEQLDKAALDYHRFPSPGKITVQPTKAMTSQRDLSLAYTPGVAAACLAIAADPALAAELTSRGNLVAVITNGSAVLGLGNIGALAGKPVMEGKGCLFKKFAGIDVFDIEINESDPDRLVDIIAAMEPTFGGINLEDIKAPQCFYIERKLRERMNIPVFHDDQHGTAIIVGAAILNALLIVGKKLETVKLACSGSGAAAIACLDQLVQLGVDRNNIWVSDADGVIYSGRNESMYPENERYAQKTDARSLSDIIRGADIFLGLSAANVLTADMLKSMADRPIVMALANPDPEIRPEVAIAARPDAIIATGRSDYPNQVNNVLCFPFIFRGALDVGATAINDEMKLAALHAIAELARTEQSDLTASAYGTQEPKFGPDFLIPRPFDPRLITSIAPAVAKAAMKSGVATHHIENLDEYRRRLENFIYRSGNIMSPVFTNAAQTIKRVIYAEGEDQRVLRAAQIVADEKLARPVLLGRLNAIKEQIHKLGLRLRPGENIDVVNTEDKAVINRARLSLHTRAGMPDGVSSSMEDSLTLMAAEIVNRGGADALICGIGERSYYDHLATIAHGIGHKFPNRLLAAMNLLLLPKQSLFMCDTYVNSDPSPEDLANIATLAADELRHFGLTPSVGVVSPANHAPTGTASKVAAAVDILKAKNPKLAVTGPIHVDVALKDAIESKINLLILPTLDAANIAFNMLKVLSGEGITVGPILLGPARPAHILTPAHTVRGVVNMTAFAAAQAAHLASGWPTRAA